MGERAVNTPLAPLDGTPAAGDTQNKVRLANTGTTESKNTVALTSGSLATISVSAAAAIRVNWAGTSSVTCATTDLELGAGASFTWEVQDGTSDFVAIEASDGSSAYEAWLWTSSPE